MVSEKDAWEYVLRRIQSDLEKSVCAGDSEAAAAIAAAHEHMRSGMAERGFDREVAA